MTDDVLVVGGGIAGLAAAIALEKQGCSVRILERDKELDQEGSALGIWANGLEALARIGLKEAVVRLGTPIGDNTVHDGSGRVIQASPYAAMNQRFGIVGTALRRCDLRSVLAEAVDSPIEWGCRVASISQGTDTVDVVAESGDRFQAGVILGCDGVFSAVRGAVAGRRGEPRGQDMIGWRGILPWGELHGDATVPGEWWGRGVAFGSHRFGHGAFWYSMAKVPGGGASMPRERYGPEVHARATAVFAQMPPVVRHLIARTPAELVRWDEIFRSAYQRRPGRGSVTLLGDAAHVPSPALGQGACLSLEDGVVAGACIGRWGPTDGALREYEHRRIRRVRQVVRASRAWESVKVGRQPASIVARTVIPFVPERMTLRAMARIWDAGACDVA